MGLSTQNLRALQVFSPSQFDGTLQFFEFLKYETKPLRAEEILEQDALFEAFTASPKTSKKENKSLRKDFNDLIKKLDSTLLLRNNKEGLADIKWNSIDEFCNLLRLIERSDERKVRWVLYSLFSSGKPEITKEQILSVLGGLKVSNLEKLLKKIVKDEYTSGLNASFDGKKFVINHEPGDKIVGHYLADAIGEPSRRSPGELEDETLELLDEGSYSNQEIANALMVDEAMVSRSITKLREKDEVVLSSFGKKGMRYYTTNCDNCPFGTTKASCRKEALSYIINSFKEDFGIDLNATDFDDVEANQAILKIKRIVMIAKKDKDTKLERSVSESLSKMLGKVVDESLEVGSSKKGGKFAELKMELSPMARLPMLYQLGLLKGAKSGISLMDETLRGASKSIKKEDRLKIKKSAFHEANKFLKTLGLGSEKD